MENIKMVIGKEYVEGTFSSEDSAFVEKAYREIVRVHHELFALIPYEVQFTDEDSYTSAKQMRAEVQRTGIIKIYTGWSGHPFLTQEENNIGRAVHDVWAHLVCGCPFSFEGEYTAYLEQRRYYPEWTWKVLFAEIPAQTAGFYYTEGFNFNQRAIEAPDSWIEMTADIKMDYSHNSILKSLLRK